MINFRIGESLVDRYVVFVSNAHVLSFIYPLVT